MAKRLVRAKHKVRVAGIPYRVPPAAVLPERSAAVLGVVYLLFNEGYAAMSGAELARRRLCDEAIHLAGTLADLMPDEPEAAALHALLLLHDARRGSRVDTSGRLVPLQEQDRSRWDAVRIDAGLAALARALRPGQVGPYQVQAAMASTTASTPPPRPAPRLDAAAAAYRQVLAMTGNEAERRYVRRRLDECAGPM